MGSYSFPTKNINHNTIISLIMLDEENTKKDQNEEKPFVCTGCKTPLGKYDEKCPHCERLNPNYVLR